MGDIATRVRQGLSRWADGTADEAKQLQTEAVRAGCTSIADAPARERVVLQGSLRTLTLRPRGGVPALEAELYDGTGTITVVWLGRRRIAGISPGRQVRVEGRVALHEGQRVIFNPRYELRCTA
ncbi:OB-fold nucleic acid binding domain-containing protein [Nocardioides massiliensis]|uniref:RecG-like helicase n=1 Tax=Nocardioides massiliensis TaxID=1325935 RepID=A0ABT9NT28_9ACTN|nr:OB-fold nucleic acid binding domain-containing protein [Nocardioides massiliensis]MDP9823334.1 RecG-like helicase [Nocardioides massiliensis]